MAILLHDPGGRPMASQRALVACSLEFAVPEAIAALGAVPGPVRASLAGDCEGLLDAHGDLAWLAVRAHEDGDGLTRLARGLAALACRPGGVTFLGTRWVAVAAWDAGQAAALGSPLTVGLPHDSVDLPPRERGRDMATVKINTSDVAWVERMHAVTAAEIVTYGTDIKGAVYFQVEVEVETVEHVTFAGAKMIRFDLGANAPADANRHAMYPETYLVRA